MACCAAVLGPLGAAAVVPSFPTGMTFSLLAWGFDNGGKDPTEGAQAVIVDMDMSNAASVIQSMREAGQLVICYM